MTATADHWPWELSFPASGVPSPNDPARNQCIYPRTELSCHEREGRMPPWMGVPCTDWISLWEMGQAAASCSHCTHMETLEAAPRLRAKPVSPNILPGRVTSHGYSGKCGSIKAAWLHPSLGYIHPALSGSNLGIFCSRGFLWHIAVNPRHVGPSCFFFPDKIRPWKVWWVMPPSSGEGE